MLAEQGKQEYEKWAKWISDDNYDLSPDFVPDETTPRGAIDYYKDMMSMLVDFDSPSFTWPTGVGLCL